MPIHNGPVTQTPSFLKEILVRLDAQKPQLKKAGNVFYFPEEDKNKKHLRSSIHTRLSDTTDLVVEKLFTFIKPENLQAESSSYAYAGKTSTHLFHEEELWIRFAETYDNEHSFSGSVNKKVSRLDENKFFAKLSFQPTGSLSISPAAPLKRTMVELLTDKEGAQKTSFNSKGFLDIIDTLNAKIDDLFVKNGYEATLENRDNLISLVWGIGPKLLKVEEVRTFLGTDKENHKFNNLNLIKLASQGYSSGLVKLFYFYDYYPNDLEDFETLKTLPYDIFLGVLGGTDS